jgi:hypothetical protein
MKTNIAILLAGWILLNVPDCIIAQEQRSLVPGERVRVTSTLFNGKKIVGSVGTIETDFFLLNVEDQPAPLNIPFSTITRLEISQGRKAKTITGSIAGLIVGAGVGALVGNTEKEGSSSPEMVVVAYAAIGGLAGSLLGLVVGSAIHTERWTE